MQKKLDKTDGMGRWGNYIGKHFHSPYSRLNTKGKVI